MAHDLGKLQHREQSVTVFVLVLYTVDVRIGQCRHLLTATGEDELAMLTRILARSGYDFDVRADHNTGTELK